MLPTLLTAILLSSASAALGAYNLAKEYSGQNFFQGWDFYGAPDLTTDGDVNWVTEPNATASHLAYVNAAGNAIIGVDNTTYVKYPNKRDTVRITTEDYFPVGSVFIIDATHLPYGCSVWPSFWTKGPNWPNDGEIDIIETINLMQTNQYALHTGGSSCLASSTNQTGTLGSTNCSSPTGAEPGCTFTEAATDSVGAAFASAGGGVYATQFDTSGIYIWFWSRDNIPSSVTSATNSIDTSSWGEPSAAYSASSCDITEYFAPQQLVLDITLCGKWAGDPTIYAQTCPTNASTLDDNTCYYNNVINTNGSAYSTAYFELSYIKAFTTTGNVFVNSSSSSSSASGSATSGAPSSSATGSAGSSKSGAVSNVAPWGGLQAGLVGGAALVLAALSLM